MWRMPFGCGGGGKFLLGVGAGCGGACGAVFFAEYGLQLFTFVIKSDQ